MDSTDQLLHELFARSGGIGGDTSSRPPIYKVIGIVLAISSGVFIGTSFVLKKHGLLKANEKYNEEAGEGYGYLKNWYWWTGMTLMIVGEICNFVAYAFVDAILVTPMGALSVVICAILSAIFLKERLSFVGKVGCFNCIIGSVVIVINAPTQSAVANIQDMKRLVIAPGFLSYAGVVIVACVIIALWLGPKYGKRSMMVYLSICSLIGGLSVVATQGLGAAIISAIGGTSGQFTEWFFYVLLVFVISTLLTEIIYLNKALNLFNAALVTPTYYVFFTSATIVTSAILFQGFKGTASTISTVIMGFLQICAGVVLLQLSKSAKDVPDAAVFKGDLDQVRTVAEQEEPEYEPRADTIRGGGAILRSISKARSEKQMMEAKRLQEEHMQPIGEDEQVEFDGLRRRRTVGSLNHPERMGTVVRHKTIHPPLGMSHFPQDDSDDDTSYHPGFFQRLRSRGKSTSSSHTPSVGLTALPPSSIHGSVDGASDKDSSYAKAMQTDTSYRPHETTIHFGDLPHPSHPGQHERQASGDSLQPPKPPPHTAKRQFSFQNVFGRNRTESGGEASIKRPASKGGRKSSRDGKNIATEEERLGLVKGDSRILLPIPSRDSTDLGPPSYSDNDDDWRVARSPSPGVSPGRGPSAPRRVDTEGSEIDPYDEKDYEKSRNTSAFL
ncbi:DUF803-domain-containing protein [Lentithecium fluviatile CBS 122367]|uniref:DUF803-domain-containing protein n=1 Tax=Lentithecium fluviatile CBS 122367 TaxID=1168545 RepID=A0A6G1IDM2_9PLEO|nr:DUF803-domain-containing protein [Lentithecium fluviatile CBS 122367]